MEIDGQQVGVQKAHILWNARERTGTIQSITSSNGAVAEDRNFLDSLATRAFFLLRKLSKDRKEDKLEPEEIHEFIEIIKGFYREYCG